MPTAPARRRVRVTEQAYLGIVACTCSAAGARDEEVDELMKRTGYTLTLLLFPLVLAASEIATKVYRWTDADGVVQFGQQKPPDVAAQRVTISHRSESSTEAQAKLDRLKEQAGLGEAAVAKDEQKKQDAAAKKVAGVERKQECALAAENLQKLGNWAKHILVDDSGGNPSTMDSVQRQAAIERIQKWRTENNCR